MELNYSADTGILVNLLLMSSSEISVPNNYSSVLMKFYFRVLVKLFINNQHFTQLS